MFSRIKKIRGVGLFRDADASRHELRRLSLLYGANAAGKSTLSAILRSLAAGDPSIVSERRTFNFEDDQFISIQDADGLDYEFKDGEWERSNPNVFIFDSAFVDSNVYSGSSIETGHQRSLLDFAIGEEAVAVKAKEAAAAKEAKEKRAQVKHLESDLKNRCDGMPLTEFLGLPTYDDPEQHIAALEEQLDRAKRIVSLKGRPRPNQLPRPNLDLTEVARVLEASLESLHEHARATVEEHIASLHDHEAESWLSTGLRITSGNSCPFCGQSIEENDLIESYRQYFDEEYRRLEKDVANLPRTIERVTSSADAELLIQKLQTQKSIEELWSEDLDLNETRLDEEELRTACTSLRAELETLANEKALNPIRPIEGGRVDQVQSTAEVILAAVDDANRSLQRSREEITQFVEGLEALDQASIEQELRRYKLSMVRHSDSTDGLCEQLLEAQNAAEAAEAEKDRQRAEARDILDTLLEQFRQAINELLDEFSASFSIERLEHDYRGGSDPRIQYALSVRNETLRAGQDESLLKTVLSDGDKRALAFAFFVARLRQDSSMADKIVVMDDPMTSLDLNRRGATIDVVVNFVQNARQVLVLAHDPYFLRDLQKAVAQHCREVAVRTLKTTFVDDDAVAIQEAELDGLCEADYTRHYRLVQSYLNGEGERYVAVQALRPLMEGYLQRRFPTHFSSHVRLARMIDKIEGADEDSPLKAASNEVDQLEKINVSTRSSHHAQEADYAASVELSEAELRRLCRNALGLVHGWGSEQ